ncbi:M23 family metallopeptidase [Candidatus Methylomirabilis sp.]|uniref:M23 family metallopeptidase n=1 Tax=Candidatus Methylomirabilis sp. TaxID=2032687 RepID=UPI0030767F08
MKKLVAIAIALFVCMTLDSGARAEPLDALTLRQGDVRIVKVADGAKTSDLQGVIEMGGVSSAIPIFSKGGALYGIVAVDLYQQPGEYRMTVYETATKRALSSKALIVKQGEFQKSVSPRWNTQVFGQTDLDRIAREKKEMADALHTSSSLPLWQDGTIYPIEKTDHTGLMTTPFGQIRVNPAQDWFRFHRGTDFQAPEGFPIWAIAAGRVAHLGHDYLLEGNITVIDHGLGIFSSYLHQSAFLVKVGDEVKKGEVIGRVGSTGNSNAPHLHLALRIGTALVDPTQFIEALRGL